MSLKPSRRGLLIGMGATAADAVLPVQANTRDDPLWPLALRGGSDRKLLSGLRPGDCPLGLDR
jgi:hypothetical protein